MHFIGELDVHLGLHRAQEYEVAEQISWKQRLSARVQCFEDNLRVVVALQLDHYDHERVIQCLKASEKPVLDGHVASNGRVVGFAE